MRRSILVAACLAACNEPESEHELPDGPFVQAVLRYDNGRAREVTATAEYRNDAGTGRCSGEHELITFELAWPHEMIARGDFDLDDRFEIVTSMPKGEGDLVLRWSGWIQFDEITADTVDGRFELDPLSEPADGLSSIDRGAFSCPVGP